MKHRIWGDINLHTWLWWGPWEMDNSWYVHPLILWKVYYAIRAYKEYARVDFKVTEHYTQIWFEASYQMDKERYVQIHKFLEHSKYVDGIAWWFYGSDVAKTTKYYSDFKKNCKTKRLLYRLHELIYPDKPRIF